MQHGAAYTMHARPNTNEAGHDDHVMLNMGTSVVQATQETQILHSVAQMHLACHNTCTSSYGDAYDFYDAQTYLCPQGDVH